MRGRTSVPITARRPGAGPRAWAAAGSAAALLLAGCGGDDPAGEASGSSAEDLGTVTVAEDGVQELTLQTQDDYVFTPDRFTVAPGKVRLTLVNVADEMTHNLVFDEGKGPE